MQPALLLLLATLCTAGPCAVAVATTPGPADSSGTAAEEASSLGLNCAAPASAVAHRARRLCSGTPATDALLACVDRLLRSMPAAAAALLCLERRVNFCLAGLAPRAPAAEHFAQGVCEREHRGEWIVERLAASSVPQRFVDYERGPPGTLELWWVRLEAVAGQ